MEHTEAEIDSVISRQNVAKEGWTTYYVDGTDGNDGNNGLRWESAFKTIQAAINKAESWAKIYIKSGTYVENVFVNKEGIDLIGEKRSTVIIKPAAGVALIVINQLCTVRTLSVYSPIAAYGLGIDSAASRVKIIDVELDGVPGAYGMYAWGNYAEIRHCRMANVNLLYGIGCDGDYCDIHDNYIDLTHASSSACIQLTGSYNKVYENELLNCDDFGVDIRVGGNSNSIYHNNFIGNGPKQIYDLGAGNKFFENFYDDHTVDTDNDGLCDTKYIGDSLTAIDYQPVSRRNGWNQISLGAGAGGGEALYGGKEIWESFEYPSDATLRARWIEGGDAGNPARSATAYWGQYSMQVVIGVGAGYIYRLLPSRNMNPIANITIAGRSNNAGDTFRFTLYDSAGNYSYWTQTLIGADTWYLFEIEIHSIPTGSSATPVDLEDVVEIRLAELVAGSTYLFDFITFEGLATEDLEDILERVNQIFDLSNAELVTTETGGVVSTNGAAEVDVYINEAPAGVYKPLILKIWFTNQTAGETVVIREKYRIADGDALEEVDEETFAGVQDPVLIIVDLDPTRFGVVVTIAKTAGADRGYKWEVIYDI